MPKWTYKYITLHNSQGDPNDHHGDDDDQNESDDRCDYDQNYGYHHLNLHAHVIHLCQRVYDGNDVHDLNEDDFINSFLSII